MIIRGLSSEGYHQRVIRVIIRGVGKYYHRVIQGLSSEGYYICLYIYIIGLLGLFTG